MPDDVVVGISADAKKAEQELDKMNARIAKQDEIIQRMTSRGKKGADDALQSFGAWSLKIAGIASMATVATAALEGMLSRAKEIRDIQDTIAQRSEKNLNPAFKEFRAFKKEDQQKIEAKSQQLQAETGLTQEVVTGIISDLGQNKEKLSDLLSGKFDEIFKTAVETGMDPKELVDAIKASFVKEKNFDPTKAQITERSQLFATVGKDAGEISKLVAKSNQKISIEEGIALYNAGKDRFGAAGLKEVFSKLKGDESANKLARDFGLTPEKFKADVAELKDKEKNKLEAEGKLAIEKASLNAITQKLDVSNQKEFSKVEMTEKQKEDYNRLFEKEARKNDVLGALPDNFFRVLANIVTLGKGSEDFKASLGESDFEKNKREFVRLKYIEGMTVEQGIKAFDKAISKDGDTKTK